MITRNRCRLPSTASRGFTLIEVLVVVVIIGIVSSVVLISLDVIGDDRELQREARRLASLVELAADEAELQGRDFGIEFIRQGYRFVEYDPFFDTWTEVIGDEVLRPRRLPDDFEFSLIVEDKRVELAEQAAETDSNDDDDDDPRGSPLLERYAPHAMILSNGDLSPFDVTIIRRSDEEREVVSVLPSGQLRIGEEDDQIG